MGSVTDRPAVVLLSRGLDSATVLAVARRDGFRLYALSFRYGSRDEVELRAAARVAAAGGAARHVIADIDLGMFGAQPAAESDKQALAVAEVGLAAGDSAAGGRRCARLPQAYELLFWDTLTDAL